MAVEVPYNLEEIFQSVNFDFLCSLPDEDDLGETLCIPDDALDGMPWYSTDFGAARKVLEGGEEGEGKSVKSEKKEESEKSEKSFPSTPEREEEKGGRKRECSSSESSEGSVEFGAKKRRSGTGRKGGAGWWERFRVEGVAAEEGGGGGGGGGRRCWHCGAEKTPQWRMGPRGPKTLCNACGVRYRSGRLVPEYRPAASPSFDTRFHSNSHRRIVKMRKS